MRYFFWTAAKTSKQPATATTLPDGNEDGTEGCDCADGATL